MNQLQRNSIRGLYKEANVTDILTTLKNSISDGAGKVKDFFVNEYDKNSDIYNRVGIDTGSILAILLGGRALDAVRGRKTTASDHIIRGLTALGLAESAQYGYGKYKDIKNVADNAVDRIEGLQNENSTLTDKVDSLKNKLTDQININNSNIERLQAQLIAEKAQAALDKMRANIRGQISGNAGLTSRFLKNSEAA
jgi:hypothetical protein